MGWNAGTYTKGNNATGGWTGDASLGIGIEAGRHDTQDNDFAAGINNCVAKDGQNAATADLPMGGFKHTNVANATARNNYAAVGQVQDGDFIWLGTTGGTATAQTATATPAITAYKAGQKFRMQIGSGLGSTGSVATAHTININSIGAKNIVNNEDSTNPTLGTWVAGALMELVYDGTNFRITNDPGGWIAVTPTITMQAGTATANTTYYYMRKRGRVVSLRYYINWTQSVANATYILFSHPVEWAETGGTFAAQACPSGGTPSAASCYQTTTGGQSIIVRTYNFNNFNIGAGNIAIVAGDYYSV